MEDKNEKLMYEAPALTVYGSFESLTQGLNDGAVTDAVIPIGTPKDQITFS